MGLLDMLKSGPSIYELRTENGDSKYFIAGSKSQLKSELTVNPFYNQDLEKNYKIYSTISFEAAREQNTFDDLEFAIKNYKANDRIVVVKSK